MTVVLIMITADFRTQFTCRLLRNFLEYICGTMFHMSSEFDSERTAENCEDILDVREKLLFEEGIGFSDQWFIV